MIKKTLSFFSLLGLLSFGVIAQESSDDTFPSNLFQRNAIGKWSVGVFGGASHNHHDINTWYAIDMKYSDMSGYTLGVTGSCYLTGWLSLRADVLWVQKNFRMDRDSPYVSFMYTESTNDYFSVPVTAVLSMGRTVRLCGFFGGYVGYWMSGHRKGKSYPILSSMTGVFDDEITCFDQDYEFNSTRDNRFDAGLSYGAGLRCAIVKKIDLSLDVMWYYALTDIQKAYTRNINPRYNTTRAIQFGVSYWF